MMEPGAEWGQFLAGASREELLEDRMRLVRRLSEIRAHGKKLAEDYIELDARYKTAEARLEYLERNYKVCSDALLRCKAHIRWFEQALDKKFDVPELPTRVRNILINGGISTRERLLAASYVELVRIPLIGAKTIAAIEKALGVEFKQEHDQ